MRVVLAGGGTAGHIEPALALADALRQADPSAMIICLGTERGLETRLVPMRGYELALIPAVPLPRAVTPRLLAVPGKLAGAVSAAAGVLDRMKADVLVGFGGYVATPGYLAARRRHVPIVVHEANPRPGLANKLGARLTEHVYTGNPATQLQHATYLGIPIRREIAELDRLGLGDKARAHFGLRPDLPVLLVTGGSQGARSLNDALYGALDLLRSSGVQVLHVTGPRNETEAPPAGSAAPGAPYVAVPYVDRMDLAYAAADFALCRAGAMTCAELTAVGLPGAYVPLPHGNGEQRLNAEPIVAGGGGLMVDDADLTPEWIRDVLLPVLLDIDRVANMSEAAAALGRKDADRALAAAVINVVRAAREQAAQSAAGPGGGLTAAQPRPPFQPSPEQPAPGVRRSPGAQGTPSFQPIPPGQPPQGRPSGPPGPPQSRPLGRPPGRPLGQPPGQARSAQALPGQPMPGQALPGQALPGRRPGASARPAAAASGEQWFEPRSRRQAEAFGSTEAAASGPSGPPGPPGPPAPPMPPPPAPQGMEPDGPPWPEAEPAPPPDSRRPASRRGQPRHGRPR
jgi:UDP-N-acetylglucosamine--N-acetylmuramyl-(pentapeptide) pyrophosphoryl-undecaprenol N-acetylglucosamine transferase